MEIGLTLSKHQTQESNRLQTVMLLGDRNGVRIGEVIIRFPPNRVGLVFRFRGGRRVESKRLAQKTRCSFLNIAC